MARHQARLRGWTMALLALCAAPLLEGCVRVKAYQREALASPAMQLQTNPYAEIQERSMREILEAGTFSGGGPGGAGGGCGCK
jgi:hypothetical protein